MLKVITDTSCGLTRAEAEEAGVTMVPMTYICDGTRRREAPCGENGDYAALFQASRVVTSEAVRAGAFAEAVRRALAAGDDALVVTISSRLSGTFRSAQEAVDALSGKVDGPDGALARAQALDSWVAAGAQEYVVRHAARLAGDGASLDEAVSALRSYRAGQRVVFTVPDLSVLRRSGRLGVLRRSIATRLNRYPVMQLVSGGIRDVGVSRGADGVARDMVAMAPVGTSDLVITHYGARGVEAQRMLAAVHRRFPHARVRVKDGGPALSKNLGLGAVSLAWRQLGD